MTLTLYDALRCPYCARVRIALAEKGVPYEAVAIDLDDRPAWLYERNPSGKVPVLEDAGWVLPESAVINEYLEERYPEPALLPADPGERAAMRLLIVRFEDWVDSYYALRWGRPGGEAAFAAGLSTLDGVLAAMPHVGGRTFGLGDIAYVPWVLRSRDFLGISLGPYPALAEWLERMCARPSIAAERDVVASL